MLTFWVSFGFLYLFDNIFEFIFSFFYFYHILRAGIIMYLFLPRYDGATKIYDKVIHPLFTKYSPHINKFIAPMEQKSQKVSQNFKKAE